MYQPYQAFQAYVVMSCLCSVYMRRNPYKELCTGRRLIKSSIYNSALQGKQLLILAEADVADRNVHVYALDCRAGI
jgi:hypothetical protein